MILIKQGTLFFKSTGVWGGGERLTISVAKIVRRNQQSAISNQQVLVASNSQRFLTEAKKVGLLIQFFDLGPEVARRRDIPGFLFRRPIMERTITKLLKGYQPDYDTVVLQSLNERLLITPIAKKFGYRVLWLEFQPWTPFLVKHPYLKRLVNLTQLVDQIVVNSRFAKQELVELGISEQQVKVLHSFVDIDHFKPSQGNKKRLPKQPLTIVTVARLHQEKGIDVLVEAINILKTQNSKLKTFLKIVGEGPERSNLEAQVQHLGLEDQIQFLGEKTNVLPYLQSADLFVLPSRRDNLPVALLEAMAGGLPVIATSVGGIPEVIDDGKNGWLVPPDDPDKLVKVIGRLVESPDLQKRLGIKARKTVERKFSLEIFADRVQELFVNHSPSTG